jgi:uncharacterized protein YggE
MNRSLLITIGMIATLIPAADIFGQNTANLPSPPVIRTQGEAVLTVEPNQAEILLGVETEDTSAKLAAQNNANRGEAVLKALYEFLGRDADIRTVGYTVAPVYSNTRDGKNTITHYRATNTIRIKTDRLKQVGDIIDRANKAGANTVGSLQFTVKDDAAVRQKALEQASREARLKADAIAAALGLKIKRILEVEETGRGPRPMLRSRSFAEAAATPIEAGTLDIEAAVALTAEISQ